MPYQIAEIEGIGPSYAEQLGTANITTTDDLLQHCATPKGRSDVATRTGLSTTQLLKWANMADLMRVNGVGSEYSELLEAAGVDTVKELKTRNAENLAQRMKEVNEAKQLTRAIPSADMVTQWVAQAGKLPAAISY